jgi:hypothetical protein
MLRRDPRPAARPAWQRMVGRGQRGPSRLRLRRRLVLFSAPVVAVALLAAVKLISVVILGNAAASDFGRHDTGALRDDIATLSVLNVIAPDKLAFAQGGLAALEGDLGAADSRFSDVLSRTDASRSCPVRVNVELVRETQGDRAARDGRRDQAEQHYASALAVIKDAPQVCFQGNSDPNSDRRAIRNDAAPRLADKINALHTPLPSSPSPPRPPAATSPPAPPPPPPPPPVGAPGPGGDAGNLSRVDPDRLPGTNGSAPALRLDPGSGNPLDRLREALGDADASGGGG